MKVSFDYRDGDFTKAMLLAEQKIAAGLTGAMRETGTLAKEKARASIAAGGFSGRFQDALREQAYPRNGVSLRPAASIWLKVPYGDVFEEGMTIEGHPLEWVPLPSVPKGPGGKHLSPSELIGMWGKIISINVPGKPPLLAAVVKDSSPPGPWGRRQFSAKQLRQGGAKTGASRIIPLYVGVPSVTDPKKFDVIAAVKEAATHFAEFFARELED